MKTIFFVITKGIVSRNILLTGVVDRLLKKGDIRAVIFVPEKAKVGFEARYQHPNLVFEIMPDVPYSRFRKKIFLPFLRNLVFNKTQQIILRYGTGKKSRYGSLQYAAVHALFWPLSHLPFFRGIMQWVELHLYPDYCLGQAFEKYQPSCAVQLSVLSREDVALLKEAKRRGVATVAIPKGWDTLDKLTLQIQPDHFLVQNKPMRAQAFGYHFMKPDEVTVTGFPIYDWYGDPSRVWTREKTCASLGVDPARSYIVYGSEGPWSRGDVSLVSRMAVWFQDERFKNFSLIVRPYFIDIREDYYKSVRGMPQVVLDDSHTINPTLTDLWDPTEEEIVKFINMIRYAACVVCVRSTLSLDAAVLDRPIINVVYDAYVDRQGMDRTKRLYEVNFYKTVVDSGGVELVHSDTELQAAIAQAIAHPEYRVEGRKKLCEVMCDGPTFHATDAIAEALYTIAQK